VRSLSSHPIRVRSLCSPFDQEIDCVDRLNITDVGHMSDHGLEELLEDSECLI
jgi:hypothetical protein